MGLSRQFPLNALRVFEAVARLGSFTKAGDELGLTQTAVSYQIKLLEENIGEALFLRRPRQISLTETGERLVPKVVEAFAILQEAMASVREPTDETLIIHSTATFAQHWLARNLGSFQVLHPNIAVRLKTSDDVVAFTQDAADVAIRSGNGKWPGLSTDRLIIVDFTPMLSPRLAEEVGGIQTPEDLLKLRIIDAGDPWWAVWFQAAGVKNPDLASRPRTRLGAQSFEASAAIAGLGVAILTPEFYRDDLASGRLLQPFPLVCDDGRNYWLAYPESRRNIPKIKAFRNWITAAVGPRAT